MIVGKKPRRLQNLNNFEGWVNLRFWVIRLISIARAKPRIVTAKGGQF